MLLMPQAKVSRSPAPEGLPRDRIWHRASGPLDYFVFAPASAGPDAPIMVAVHGISRNAAEHARRFAIYAEQAGAILVAPLFDKRHYRGYQRLASRGRAGGAGMALQAILNEVRSDFGCRTQRIRLFGYSGGGQFAHRYAMAWPELVERVAVASPGWYTLPDSTLAFPRGLKTQARHPWKADPHTFLRIPFLVMVGDRDTERDANLRHDEQLDLQQGLTRVERGRCFVESMTSLADQLGIEAQIRFQLLTDVGHSFTECMNHGRMGSELFNFFFAGQDGRAVHHGELS